MLINEKILSIITILHNHRISFVNRCKEEQTRDRLGITVRDQIDMIKNLTIKDYYKGPYPDTVNAKNDMWEFKVNKYGAIIYIKIKYHSNKGYISAVCHIDNIQI